MEDGAAEHSVRYRLAESCMETRFIAHIVQKCVKLLQQKDNGMLSNSACSHGEESDEPE